MVGEPYVLKPIAVTVKIKIDKKSREERQLSANPLGPELKIRIIGSSWIFIIFY